MPIRQPTVMSSRSYQDSLQLEMVPVRAAWENRDWSFDEFCVPTVLNDYSYRVIGEGRTGATEPANWPTTPGLTLVDGGVTWQCYPQSGTLELTSVPPTGFLGYSTAFCYIDLPDGGAADMEIRCWFRDGTTGGWADLYSSMDQTFVWQFFRAKNHTATGQIMSINFRWKDSVPDERIQYPLMVEASGLYQGA